MRKERVEMRFRSQMQDLMKVGMVYVRKNAQQLPIHVLYGRGKARGEFVACLCGKCAFVVEEILTPCHYVVDVGRRR